MLSKLKPKQSKDYFVRLLVEKYYFKRLALTFLLRNREVPMDARIKMMHMLADLPRNSSATRVVNRCILTGRQGWVLREFKLCRNQIKELAGQGEIPGLRQSSW